MKHRLFLIVPALAMVALAGACNVAMSDASEVMSTGGSSFDAAAPSAADAGVGAAIRSKVGLCNTDQGTCQPDDRTACEEDAGSFGNQGDAAALPPTLDGGAFDAGAIGDAGIQPIADGSTLACRVVRRGTSVGPQCTVAGAGKDGDACRASLDCAVGFDCVGNPGQCRRYCCEGSKSCGADRVCDKQTLTGDETVTVPVCAPVHPCQLLAPKACPNNQTCAIADQRDGRTSCVTIGAATVGESCENTNCAAGLTCLGQDGTRSCFKLCVKSKMGECPTDTKCKGSAPLFTDPEQGVCIKDVASY